MTDAGQENQVVDLVAAVHRLRQADADLSDRRREMTGRGHTDTRALDLIRAAEAESLPLTPKELAAQLRISTASTTILLHRLARDGLVERRPHPRDRRSIHIHPTESRENGTVDPVPDVIAGAADGLSEEERAVVVGYLLRLSEALEASYRPAEASQQPPRRQPIS